MVRPARPRLLAPGARDRRHPARRLLQVPLGPEHHLAGPLWTGSNVSPGLRLDLPLGEQSSLQVAGRYTKIDGDINAQGLAGLAPDGRTAIRYQYHEVSTWKEYQTDTFVATRFRTGRVDHRIVAGVEAGLSTADSDIGIGPATPLDVLNPVYPPEPEPVARPTRYDVSRVGVYAVDQVRFGERLIVVPALRWSAGAVFYAAPPRRLVAQLTSVF